MVEITERLREVWYYGHVHYLYYCFKSLYMSKLYSLNTHRLLYVSYTSEKLFKSEGIVQSYVKIFKITFLIWQNYGDRGQVSSCQGAGDEFGRGCEYKVAQANSFVVMVVVVTQIMYMVPSYLVLLVCSHTDTDAWRLKSDEKWLSSVVQLTVMYLSQFPVLMLNSAAI